MQRAYPCFLRLFPFRSHINGFIVLKIRKSRIPIAIFLAFGAAEIVSSFGGFPSMSVISSHLNELFVKYGLLAVFAFSFIENLFGVNAYFPGSVVILTSMSMTAGNVELALETYASIVVGAVIAYNVNYIVGRFFSRKVRVTEGKVVTHILFLSTFWHPSLAALTCFASGANGVSYFAFVRLFLFSGFIWNTFWGLLMYNVGLLTSANFDLTPIMYVYLSGWVIASLYKDYKLHSSLVAQTTQNVE